MTIETIDNVQYYVWRAGDELPKYQPIEANIMSGRHCGYQCHTLTEYWNGMFDHITWPKLLNDRAQHQRMIDEAFEHTLNHDDPCASIARHTQLAYMHSSTVDGNKQYALDHLAKAGAYVKRMMQYVQEQIDKDGEKI